MSTRFRWGLALPLVVLLTAFGCNKGSEESGGGGESAGGGGESAGGGGNLESGGNMYSGEEFMERQELARRDIRGLMDRSRGYFDRFSRFPESAPLTPAEPPCGPDGSPLNSADWEPQATWSALRFLPRDPFHYSYQYDSTGTGEAGTRFVVTVIGDLDCDGERATFQRGATVQGDGVIGSDAEITETNPDE